MIDEDVTEMLSHCTLEKLTLWSEVGIEVPAMDRALPDRVNEVIKDEVET